MLMPSIFGESLLDDFFGNPFDSYKGTSTDLMRTDIKDTDGGYEITMNLPGVRKEDVKAELKDGYLTVTASSNTNRDEKDSQGRYIRRERFAGACERSFYVGEELTHEDIKGEFKHGILRLTIPKKVEKPEVPEKKFISIEG